MENLFNIVASCLLLPENKAVFVEAEGAAQPCLQRLCRFGVLPGKERLLKQRLSNLTCRCGVDAAYLEKQTGHTH